MRMGRKKVEEVVAAVVEEGEEEVAKVEVVEEELVGRRRTWTCRRCPRGLLLSPLTARTRTRWWR